MSSGPDRFPDREPTPSVFTIRQKAVIGDFADMMRGSEADDALRIAIADQHAAYLKERLLVEEDLDLNDPLQWYVFMRGAIHHLQTVNEELAIGGGEITSIAEVDWEAVDNACLILAALAPPQIHQEFRF